MKKYISIIIFLMSAWSCTKTLDFKEAETDQQFVINCIISPDSTFSAIISKSHSVIRFQPFELVTNVPLNLYEDGNLIGEISAKNGIYRDDFKPQSGKTYRLMAEIDGKEVDATTQIPEKVDIVSVDTTTVQSQWGYNELNFKISFDDPDGEDYYRLVVLQDVLTRYDWGNDSITYYRQYYSSGVDSNDPVFKTLYNDFGDNQLDSGPDNHYNLFSDVNFNGQKYSIQFKVNSFQEGNPDIIYYKYEIHLLKMSKEFFNYLKYLNLYNYYHDDPFSEPVPVYSNVNNGTGIFGGYNDNAKLTYEKVYIPYSMDTIHPVNGGYGGYGYGY